MTTPEVPENLEGVRSLGAIAIRELREIPGRVKGEAEQFIAAAVIVGAAVRQRAGEADLLALRREAKALGLMNFGEFGQVVQEARSQAGDGEDEGDGPGLRGASQATRLVNIATRMYEFGVTRTGDPFAVPRDGGSVVRMLRGGRPALRPELSCAMFAAEGTAPNGSALTDAMAVLEGLAQQADPVDLALRVARHDGALLLDLGDVTGRVIAVTPDGWGPIDRSPVLFRRTAATLPLPEPVSGQDLDDSLFVLLNISRDDRPLMKALLIHHLWPNIAHVIARLTGRDGTAKTWATRLTRSLIDPCAAPTRAMPKDETDWIIAVNAALIAAIDNVSSIPDWLSDAMCRASTGEGLMRRKLYTDQDVSILSARRIVILNGIDATIRRADFARRIADFGLEPIKKIKSDDEVEAEWTTIHPYALGALLDLTVKTLQQLPGTALAGDEESLTMSMFARIAKTVGEPTLKLYVQRLGTAAADLVDADVFAGRLIRFVDAQPEGKWTGLASELVAKIPPPDPSPKGWPQDATRFGTWVRRMGRVLESTAGIRITKEERTSQGQPYTLERIPVASPATTGGKTATSATQLQGRAAASSDARPGDTAGEPLQLYSYTGHDQHECSSVADVAEIPALMNRAKADIRAGCGACGTCGERLDPALAAAGLATHPTCGEDPAA